MCGRPTAARHVHVCRTLCPALPTSGRQDCRRRVRDVGVRPDVGRTDRRKFVCQRLRGSAVVVLGGHGRNEGTRVVQFCLQRRRCGRPKDVPIRSRRADDLGDGQGQMRVDDADGLSGVGLADRVDRRGWMTCCPRKLIMLHHQRVVAERKGRQPAVERLPQHNRRTGFDLRCLRRVGDHQHTGDGKCSRSCCQKQIALHILPPLVKVSNVLTPNRPAQILMWALELF